MAELCPPSLIYLIFSLLQVLLDVFYGLYNTAFVKLVFSSIYVVLLNYLCTHDLAVISWILVFLPFIYMSAVVAMILYLFGLNTSQGLQNTVDGHDMPQQSPYNVYQHNYSPPFDYTITAASSSVVPSSVNNPNPYHPLPPNYTNPSSGTNYNPPSQPQQNPPSQPPPPPQQNPPSQPPQQRPTFVVFNPNLPNPVMSGQQQGITVTNNTVSPYF